MEVNMDIKKLLDMRMRLSVSGFLISNAVTALAVLVSCKVDLLMGIVILLLGLVVALALTYLRTDD